MALLLVYSSNNCFCLIWFDDFHKFQITANSIIHLIVCTNIYDEKGHYMAA